MTPTARTLSAGIIAVNVDGIPGQEVASSLWSRSRIVTRATRRFVEGTQEGVRFSVAFYNTEDELNQALEALAAIVKP